MLNNMSKNNNQSGYADSLAKALKSAMKGRSADPRTLEQFALLVHTLKSPAVSSLAKRQHVRKFLAWCQSTRAYALDASETGDQPLFEDGISLPPRRNGIFGLN